MITVNSYLEGLETEVLDAIVLGDDAEGTTVEFLHDKTLGRLIVYFRNSNPHCAWHRYRDGERAVRPEGFTINSYVYSQYRKYMVPILQELTDVIFAAREEGRVFKESVYLGEGTAACLALCIATQSPPHKVVTQDMPLFCEKDLLDKINETVYARNLRLIESGHPSGGRFDFFSLEDVNQKSSQQMWFSKRQRLGDVLWYGLDGRARKNPPRWLVRLHEFFSRPVFTR